MQSGKLAIATTDGVSVCDHLARSTGFVVFEIQNGAIGKRSLRTRASDACGNHRSFVELLEGCDAVICGGIGQGAVDALSRFGIESIVTSERLDIEAAAARFLSGELQRTDERVCLCG